MASENYSRMLIYVLNIFNLFLYVIPINLLVFDIEVKIVRSVICINLILVIVTTFFSITEIPIYSQDINNVRMYFTIRKILSVGLSFLTFIVYKTSACLSERGRDDEENLENNND